MNVYRTAFWVVALCAVAHADDAPPPSVKVPAKVTGVAVENYGHTSFHTAKDDGAEVVIAGKHWTIDLDNTALPGDERARWATLVAALEKTGWKRELAHQDWNPPYVSMKQVKAGKESWLYMWVPGNEARIEIIEKGDPPHTLALSPPTDGIAKVGDGDDFPFLKRFPGAKLEETSHDDSVFLVPLEQGKEPVMVASGSVIKRYELPPNTLGLEEEKVYEKALKAAGWTITDVNDAVTTGDPNLTAHYAKGPVDLWVHVHAGGKLQVADAGAERASTKLKAELDKTCKVAIYGVNFDFDKTTLRKDATPALEGILKLLTDYKDLKVELGGHTDNVGERAYNQKLSEARVGTVKDWLVKKGIAPGRLTTKGYADTVPLVPNDSPENQAKNRRVELKKVDCTK